VENFTKIGKIFFKFHGKISLFLGFGEEGGGVGVLLTSLPWLGVKVDRRKRCTYLKITKFPI